MSHTVCIWLEALNSDVDLLEETIETFIAEKGANCVIDCHCSESFTEVYFILFLFVFKTLGSMQCLKL